MLRCMRTNIVLNDELLREAARYGKGRSKRALVEEALQTFVAVKSAERRRATYRERLSSLDARLGALRLRESPSRLLRQDRQRS
jgi:Arc/MetJ family transcription regulator